MEVVGEEGEVPHGPPLEVTRDLPRSNRAKPLDKYTQTHAQTLFQRSPTKTDTILLHLYCIHLHLVTPSGGKENCGNKTRAPRGTLYP